MPPCHLDLKAMPVRFYYGYNYFIIFFDDNTSHSWTVNLKNKSDANPAIRQYIAKITPVPCNIVNNTLALLIMPVCIMSMSF